MASSAGSRRWSRRCRATDPGLRTLRVTFSMRRPLVLIAALGIVRSSPALAQGSAPSFVGVVRTAAGQPLADAQIDALNSETGVRLSVTTDRGGRSSGAATGGSAPSYNRVSPRRTALPA